MARGSSQALGAATTGQNLANTYSSNAGSLFGALDPMLMSEAAHPSGIDPTTMARMDTASRQSAGGSMASAVGEGRLRAARTRNAGGGDAATADAARSSSEAASKGILGNRIKSAELQDSQRRSAMSGLGSLFGQNMSGGNAALGEVSQAVNANTNEENASWDWAKDLFNPIMESGARVGAAKLGG